MKPAILICAVALFFLPTASVRSQPPPLGLRVPAGFEVSEFADSKLANDIYCLTIDPRGRIVVSGRGYIRILSDDDNDGPADRAIDFADGPADGAMGLLWEGTSLFFTGDSGLRRFKDDNHDDRADGPSELLHPLKTGGEHDAHAVRRGPDGRLYVLCGNSAKIDKGFAQLPTSPVKDPIAGCVLRFSPDLKQTEIFADGFRNPYDMDFNADGDLFTFDSDNERCVSLPWYEPTRFYHVIPGGHYGWENPQHAHWWRLPPYFYDVVAPVTYVGRGSPTSVTCYRHTQFPERYYGGFFLGDWTFGRIYFMSLLRGRRDTPVSPLSERDKSVSPTRGKYVCDKEIFLEAVEENGFAPTSAAVHPETGDLFIAIGGRGTRGAVYRIRHREGFANKTRAVAVQRLPKPSPSLAAATATIDQAVSFPDNLRRLGDKAGPIQERLNAVRRLQRALGDLISPQVKGTVWEGYTPRLAKPDSTLAEAALPALRGAFPTGHADLDRELSRTLAMLEDDDPAMLEAVLGRITTSSAPVEDIHYLIVFARLRAPRAVKQGSRVATALIALDDKIVRGRLNRDRHWPLRMSELIAALASRDKTLDAAILNHPDFGRPDHVLFAQIPGFDRRRAAKVFLLKADADPAFTWSPPLVELLGSLPEEKALPILRRLWEQQALRDSILPLLARRPADVDREKFLESLSSPHVQTIRLALQALEKLPASNNGQLFPLLLTLRRLSDRKEERPLKESVARYLQRVTGETSLGENADAWTAWMTRRYPEFAARLNNSDGVDMAAWKSRLEKVDWTAGDSARGKAVFAKAGCATCHSGGQALGPDLLGATQRFSRDDLFTAILQPSRDVSPRYQATLIATADGKVHQGSIIYEATDGLILQTGPTATIRIAGDQITGRRAQPASLMPAGLLDKLSDGEIADVYAYLKSLAKK